MTIYFCRRGLRSQSVCLHVSLIFCSSLVMFQRGFVDNADIIWGCATTWGGMRFKGGCQFFWRKGVQKLRLLFFNFWGWIFFLQYPLSFDIEYPFPMIPDELSYEVLKALRPNPPAGQSFPAPLFNLKLTVEDQTKTLIDYSAVCHSLLQ